MRVENKFIKLKMGNNSINFTNTIMDTYLRQLVDIQFSTGYPPYNIALQNIYFKFDEKLEFEPTDEINESAFDIRFLGANYNANYIKEKITVDYSYKIDQEELQQYVGHKITAIGFSFSMGESYIVGAILDTSNYNIYVQDKVELRVMREDEFTTDGIFYSKDVEGAYHLFPKFNESWRANIECEWGILVSIGLGISTNVISEEYPVNYNSITVLQNIWGFEINRELTIEKHSEGLYPALDLYPALNLYPARVINEPIYPSEDIYPSIDLYPVESPYQYVKLKYQLYKYDEDNGIQAENKYYVINNVIDKTYDKIKEQVIYERKNV